MPDTKTAPTDSTTIDWGAYDLGAAAKPSKPFPPKGLYFLKVPAITPASFEAGDQGQLKVQLGPLFIAGGEYDGFEIRFCKISNKRYSNRMASQMGDFLLAAHSPFRPQDEAQWKAAVIATSNGLVEAACDWDAYDKVTQTTLAEGMENFPQLPDQQAYQRWVDVPVPGQKARRVWANLRVSYFRVPRKEDATVGQLGGQAKAKQTAADLL